MNIARFIHLRILSVVTVVLGSTLFAHAEEAPKPPIWTFTRSQELPNKFSAAQTLSAEYKPVSGNGPSIWLVGVAHIGTPEYYQTIQKRLDRQTVVLFEGVNGARMKDAPGAATREMGLQTKLAKALGLVFQLDAIDYRGKNFVNSDLDSGDLVKEINDKSKGGDPSAKKSKKKSSEAKSGDAAGDDESDDGELSDNATFNALMQALQGTGSVGKMLDGLTQFLGSSPEMQETSKVMLVETLGRAGEMIEMAKGMSPDMKDLFEVVLNQRNEVVIRDIRTQLARLKPNETLAVFYGAGHMDEIARRLREDLHYASATEEWDTAFTADPSKSFMPPAQIRFMLSAMQKQMEQSKKDGVDPLKGLGLGGLDQLFSTPKEKDATPAPK
jgi:hypothetical protein